MTLNGLNWSNCLFEKIQLSQDRLSGLIVNQEQAIIIALGFGLVID
ncbi:hypothetical protein ACLHWE_05650 [Vagococcus salmoninarum]